MFRVKKYLDDGTPFETTGSIADEGIMPYEWGLWNRVNYLIPKED